MRMNKEEIKASPYMGTRVYETLDLMIENTINLGVEHYIIEMNTETYENLKNELSEIGVWAQIEDINESNSIKPRYRGIPINILDKAPRCYIVIKPYLEN